MEATLYDCYICKAEGTYGVCPSCLTTLPEASSIKTETCECDCIEEICSCLDTGSSIHRQSTSIQTEFHTEYLQDHSLDGEILVKISPTSLTEWTITNEFKTWLYQLLLQWTANE